MHLRVHSTFLSGIDLNYANGGLAIPGRAALFLSISCLLRFSGKCISLIPLIATEVLDAQQIFYASRDLVTNEIAGHYSSQP